MAKFTITAARNVTAYGAIEIEAETVEAALELVRSKIGSDGDYFHGVTKVEWDCATEWRALDIVDDATGEYLPDIDFTSVYTPWTPMRTEDLAKEVREKMEWQSVNNGETAS